MKQLFRQYFELIVWVTALVMLALMDPGTDVHYSFCIFKFLGVNFVQAADWGIPLVIYSMEISVLHFPRIL